MSILKVVVNSIELDVIKDDLTMKVVNSSFEESISTPFSKYPIRILDSETTKLSLGEFEVNASKKVRRFSCEIHIGENIRTGILIQLSKVGKFRKCDLTFVSPISEITSSEISTALAPINLKNEDPIANPYEEEGEALNDAFDQWVAKAAELEPLKYPQTNWQLPRQYFADLLTEDGENATDENKTYSGFVNQRHNNSGPLSRNYLLYNQGVLTVANTTLYSPNVFVLAPLTILATTVGYKFKGSFPESNWAKSLLFASFNHNMQKLPSKVVSPSVVVDLDAIAFQQVVLDPPDFPAPGYNTYEKRYHHVTELGSFKVTYKFDLQIDNTPSQGFSVTWQGEYLGGFYLNDTLVQQGELSFTVESAQVGDLLTIIFFDSLERNPLTFDIQIEPDIDQKTFLDAHPTIDFSRYLPSWTWIDTINNLKNYFNLRWSINDVTKTIRLDFNEQDYLISQSPVILEEAKNVTSFDNIPFEKYVLQMDNEVDDYLIISREEVVINGTIEDHYKKLTTKFKTLGRVYNTTNLTRDNKSKSGVALHFYDPINGPETTETIDGLSLDLTSITSVYANFWNRWLKFLTQGSQVKITSLITATQVVKLEESQKLIFDHNSYVIEEIEYKETGERLLKVDFNCRSITY